MTRARAVALPLCLWLVAMVGVGFVIARGQEDERQRHVELFESRADSGAEFVAAYVADVFDVGHVFEAEVARPGWDESDFARTTQVLGFSAGTLLDHDGLAVAVSPEKPSAIGTDLAARYNYLGAALEGEHAVSDVVPSSTEDDPIVAFAMPMTTSDDYKVFAGAYNFSEGPLGAFLERQPIAGTFGVLVDSHGQEIMAAGDKSALARSLLKELRRSQHEPIITEDRVVVSAPVQGTNWTYILDAPKTQLLSAATANDRSEWVLLATFGLIILGGIVANQRAIAAREQARHEKEQVDRRLRLTVENAPVGMALVGLDYRFMEPNRRLCEMLGYSPEELAELTARDVTYPDDLIHGEDQLQLLRMGEVDSVELEKRYVRADGSLLWGRLSSSVVRDENGAPAYFVNQIEDVTEVRKARAQLQHRALYDPLTGLANRSLLMDRLTVALGSDRHHASVGVGYCDLDHFKAINDTYGHGVGDEVLKTVGRRLQQSVRADDTVARLGGDEFVILLHDARSAKEAATVMERARRAIQEPIVVGDVTIQTSLSGGLAFATPGSDPDVLLRDADAALYVAKNAGRGRIEVTDQAPAPAREPHVV